MLFANLALASLLVVITFSLHFAGLVGLAAFLRHQRAHPVNLVSTAAQGASILFIVLSLFGLHSFEIWIYALVYLLIGEFTALEPALYYSITAFTTVGFGDVALSPGWRVFGATEAASGFLLITWSGAFLVSLTAQIRLFEANFEHDEDVKSEP
jgi:Ion channel